MELLRNLDNFISIVLTLITIPLVSIQRFNLIERGGLPTVLALTTMLP